MYLAGPGPLSMHDGRGFCICSDSPSLFVAVSVSSMIVLWRECWGLFVFFVVFVAVSISTQEKELIAYS